MATHNRLKELALKELFSQPAPDFGHLRLDQTNP
jgi:hypothetical protein